MSSQSRNGISQTNTPSYGATNGGYEDRGSGRPLVGDKSRDKVTKIQDQVDEVKSILKDNLEKVIERGDKVSDLAERTDTLEATASRFKTSARSVRRQAQWQNRRFCCCIVIVVTVVVAIITLIILFSLKVI